MKDFKKTNSVLAVLGIFVIVMSLVAVLVFTQSVGATKSDVEKDAAASVSGRRYTYLMLGKDRASGLTDVMMLVSLNTAEKSAAIIQIPRDTYVR